MGTFTNDQHHPDQDFDIYLYTLPAQQRPFRDHSSHSILATKNDFIRAPNTVPFPTVGGKQNMVLKL